VLTKKTGSYDVDLCHAKKANYAKYQIKMTDKPVWGTPNVRWNQIRFKVSFTAQHTQGKKL